MRLNDTKTTPPIGESTWAAGAFFPEYNLSPADPPVEIPPNEPKKPPVEEPGDPYEKPPVEEPLDVPREPPVKEPPSENPDQIPPQSHISSRVHNRWAANTACTP